MEFRPVYSSLFDIGSLSLLTDFYQLTMCYGYWKKNLHHQEAVFHLFFRQIPFQGGFTVAAGLESVIHYLENFHFNIEDLNYLASLKGADNKNYFAKEFIDYLSKLKFTGQLDAVPEGTVVFPYEPLIRIQAPLIQCQLLESPFLNLINFPTLIATKAARICLAAKGDKVLEFGLRRAQGIDGALTASRSAYIGGCYATSNVLAAKLFGIPLAGTHSHSWVMVFDDEQESFQAYAEVLPDNCIFLVDTYHTLEGVKKAIKVGQWLNKQGKKLLAIRLDSGDLKDLSIKSRHLLNQAGFQNTLIVASNELDEKLIDELKKQGAQIDIWGVGTNLITAKDQPALDGVYKLSAIRKQGQEWKYKLKLSEKMIKVSNPGILQVKRFSLKGENIADVIYDVKLDLKNDFKIRDHLNPIQKQLLSKKMQAKDLLKPIFREGQCLYTLPKLSKIRDFVQLELKSFSSDVKRFLNPQLYPVEMEHSLYELKVELIKQACSPSLTTSTPS